MNNIKRILTVLCAIFLLCGSVFALASCGGEGGNGSEVGGGSGEQGGGSQGGEETGPKTYTVRITMGDGTPATAFVVQINKGDEQVALKRVDNDGSVSFELERDDYTIALMPIGNIGYWCDPAGLKIDKNSDGADIQLYSTPGREDSVHVRADENSEPKATVAYHVGAGSYYASLGASGYSYFIFTPSERGIYEVGASIDGRPLEVAYFGSPDNPMTSNLAEIVDGKFTLEVRNFNIGSGSSYSTTYLIGVKGENHDTCSLEIKKSDKELDISPMEVGWINYTPAKPPEKAYVSFTNKKVTITDIDISGADVALVLGSDGFYRLASSDGPLVYVKIDANSKYLGAFSNVAENGQFSSYFYDSEGKFTHKESYNEAMMKYAEASDGETGLYPLDEYLKEVIIKCGEFRGWWDPKSANYRFDGVSFNANNVWMFALCTVEYSDLGISADSPADLMDGGNLLIKGGEAIYLSAYFAVGDKVSFTSLPEGARVAVGDSEYTAENGKVSFTANADGAVKITITVGGSGEHIISYTVE